MTLPDDVVAVFTEHIGSRYVDLLGSDAGRTRLRVRSDTTQMLARQVAGWADLVEVEEPAAVRAELARFGALLTATYAG